VKWFERKKKVPIPGIKTWYGKKVYVTPEELKRLQFEAEEYLETLEGPKG
jgi:hypothetical protein